MACVGLSHVCLHLLQRCLVGFPAIQTSCRGRWTLAGSQPDCKKPRCRSAAHSEVLWEENEAFQATFEMRREVQALHCLVRLWTGWHGSQQMQGPGWS